MSRSTFPVPKSWLLTEHVETRAKLYGPRVVNGNVIKPEFHFNGQGHMARVQRSLARFPDLHAHYSTEMSIARRRAATGGMATCEYWSQVLPGLTERQRVLCMLISCFATRNSWVFYMEPLAWARWLSNEKLDTHEQRKRAKKKVLRDVQALIDLGVVGVIEEHDVSGAKHLIVELLPKWWKLRTDYRWEEGRKAAGDVYEPPAARHSDPLYHATSTPSRSSTK